MNRIVIVGNGFDLAHGLPTRYEDFLLFLINDAITELVDLPKSSKYSRLFELLKNPIGQNSISEYSTMDELNSDPNIFIIANYTYLGDRYSSDVHWSSSTKFILKLNSKFFDDLFNTIYWTDIEKLFFDQLSQLFNHYKNSLGNSDDLKSLNADFELLKGLLIQYISKVNPSSILLNNNLKYHFDKCFDEDDLYRSSFNPARALQILKRFENENLERTVFVNFNYTYLLNLYIEVQSYDKFIIPIHGVFHNKNSIVFGYGDEMTQYYKQLEDLDSIDVLKHFKSHYYHFNDAYSKLLFEIENFEYDVVVFGHSLGLSDRVLLNTIFENENCKAIHLYHSGSDNHFKKRVALSRHFDDKKAFRKKLMEETNYLKIDR